MPGASQGTVKDVFPKYGIIQGDNITLTFDRKADNLQSSNLTRRYTRGEKVWYLGTGERASLVCPQKEVVEGAGLLDYVSSHHGKVKSKQGEVFFTLQRLTQYFKSTASADLTLLLKPGDKVKFKAVAQPDSTKPLKAITISLEGSKEPPQLRHKSTTPRGSISRSRSPNTVNSGLKESYEGLLIKVTPGYASVWCVELGFCHLPHRTCQEAEIVENDHHSLTDVLVIGDWIRFQAESQPVENNCEWVVGKILGAVGSKLECGVGRDPSFNLECPVVKGIGVVGAVPTMEYGILYSDVLGRVYFRGEFVRARSMPRPLTVVQFTAYPDMEKGYKDCGWRAMEVSPAPPQARSVAPEVIRCDGAVCKSCYNKSVFLTTREQGDIFASCNNDFWIRIEDGNSVVGKSFTAFIIPYPHGGSGCQYRALLVCPPEYLEPPERPPFIPAHISPLPLIPQAPIPLINPFSLQSSFPSSRRDSLKSGPLPLFGTEGPGSCSGCPGEPGSDHEASLHSHSLSHPHSHRPSLSPPSPSHPQSPLDEEEMNRRFSMLEQELVGLGLEEDELLNLPGAHSHSHSGSNNPTHTSNSASSLSNHTSSEETVEMVDEEVQTSPSKEKELLGRILKNKDLFTACMVKFPDLVFDICLAK